MHGPDTTMGGTGSRFPSTSLSVVLASREGPGERTAEHLARVASIYWKPIYHFIRRVWSKSDADAKDLTQSFVAHLLERDVLTRFDTRRGNFRPWLKQCLRHFLGTESQGTERIKRGGGRAFVTFEGEGELPLPPCRTTPEQEFDRDWAREVLRRCLDDVEKRLRDSGKGEWFEAFRMYALEPDPAEPPSYRDVAGRFGISESEVQSLLRSVREDLRRRVLEVTSEYVIDRNDILSEMSEILGSSG